MWAFISILAVMSMNSIPKVYILTLPGGLDEPEVMRSIWGGYMFGFFIFEMYSNESTF